jgi:DNA repair ATPase RecN
VQAGHHLYIAMFDEFFRQLDDLRQQTARFRRVALHVHSPDSHDWGRHGDKTKNDRSLFSGEDGIAAYAAKLSPHFDLVGITDHMKCGYGCKLTNLASENGLVILPGMEVNFRPEAALGLARIHLLVFLQEGATPSDFAALFQGLDVPNDDDKRDGKAHEISGISLREWTDRVHSEDGICIAAHVDNGQGIRCRFRQTARETIRFFSDSDSANEKEHDVGDAFKEYLLESNLDAIEIHTADHAKHYRWMTSLNGVQRWISTVLTFDAHCIENFLQSEKTTFIKMTSVGLGGLKSAFKFPETRIRFQGNRPGPTSPLVLGMSIEGDANSFFNDVRIAFAENLNCLIGARGSGKSTVVEALRYVFGQNRNLKHLPKLAEPVKGMQVANLSGSVIKVAYQTRLGENRILVATFDPKDDCVTKVYNNAGDLLAVPDVEACGTFPLRLFGWSEVESLGREPRRQRELLDRLIPDLESPLQERNNLRAALEANRHEITAIASDVLNVFNERDQFIRRFSQLQEEFNQLNTPEVRELFGQLDLVQARQRLIGQLDSNAENLQSLLADEPFTTLTDGIDRLLESSPSELGEWWRRDEIDRLGVQSVQQQILASIRGTRERLTTYRDLLAARQGTFSEEVAAIQAELQHRFQSDTSLQRIADLRSNAEGRLRAVAAHRDRYRRRFEELETAITARQELASELKRLQQRIAGIRAKQNIETQKRLNAFLPQDMRVAIEFRADGDCDEMYQPLYEIYGAQGLKPKRIRRVVQDCSTPVDFAAILLKGDARTLIGLGDQDPFTHDDAAICVERCRPFGHDVGADVPTIVDNGTPLNRILAIQEVPWDDHETILLNGGPVNKKSPGQRSSAMLPLIALTETTPLVIDQPEDNLDKKLIGNVLMKVLAELKEQRQIIVCTHDPNILVGGDAEQVVVLEATSDRSGVVARHGSIDDGEIVQTVVDLLEGGAEAFDARRRRYGEKAELA